MDACTCGRADKAALSSLKKELEAKDGAIERLEEEIRKKDTEKDTLIVAQRELQDQINEIRLLLDSHANEVTSGMGQDQAAALMQRRARGISGRKRVEGIKQKKGANETAVVRMQAKARSKLARKDVAAKAEAGELPGQPRLEKEKTVAKIQARVRGDQGRKEVAAKAEAGLLPGQPRLAGDGGAYVDEMADELDGDVGFTDEGTSYFEGDESVDSDYDYAESAFEAPGNELLAGKLKLAKVYGQEEPPAAEDELEWEVRYFVLYDTQRIVHYDDIHDGIPDGDRGLIDLASISAVKVVKKASGAPTFVMTGKEKVYLLKLEPHDEVMYRTWIGAISQELTPAVAAS